MNNCEDTNSVEYVRIFHDGKLMSEVASISHMNSSAGPIEGLHHADFADAADSAGFYVDGDHLDELVGAYPMPSHPMIKESTYGGGHHHLHHRTSNYTLTDILNNISSSFSSAKAAAAAGGASGELAPSTMSLVDVGSTAGADSVPLTSYQFSNENQMRSGLYETPGAGAYSTGYMAEQLNQEPCIYSMEFAQKYPHISNFRNVKERELDSSAYLKEKLKTAIRMGKKPATSTPRQAAAKSAAKPKPTTTTTTTCTASDSLSSIVDMVAQAEFQIEQPSPAKSAAFDASVQSSEAGEPDLSVVKLTKTSPAGQSTKKRKAKPAQSAASLPDGFVSSVPAEPKTPIEQPFITESGNSFALGEPSALQTPGKKSKARKAAPKTTTDAKITHDLPICLEPAKSGAEKRDDPTTVAADEKPCLSSSSSSSSSSTSSKRMKTLPEMATNIMKEWFDAHREKPYPTDDERRRMAQAGQISESQVKAWFANKRNRTNNARSKAKTSTSKADESPAAGDEAAKLSAASAGEEPSVSHGFPVGGQSSYHSSASSTAAAELYHHGDHHSTTSSMYNSAGNYAAFNSPLHEKTSALSLSEIISIPPLQVSQTTTTTTTTMTTTKKSRSADSMDKYYSEAQMGDYSHLSQYGSLNEPYNSSYESYACERRVSEGHLGKSMHDAVGIDHNNNNNSGPRSMPELSYFSDPSQMINCHTPPDYFNSSCSSSNNYNSYGGGYGGYEQCHASTGSGSSSNYYHPSSTGLRAKESSSFIDQENYQADYSCERRFEGQMSECIGSYIQLPITKHHQSYLPASPGDQVSFMSENLNAINTTSKYVNEVTFNSYNSSAAVAGRGYLTNQCITPPPVELRSGYGVKYGHDGHFGGGGSSCYQFSNSMPDTPSGTYSNPVSSVSSVSSSCELNLTSSSTGSSFNSGFSNYSSSFSSDMPSACDYASPVEMSLGNPFEYDSFLNQTGETRPIGLGEPVSYTAGTHHAITAAEAEQPWRHPTSASGNQALDFMSQQQLSASSSSYEFSDVFNGQFQSSSHPADDYMDNLELFSCDDYSDKDSKLLTKIIAEDSAYSLETSSRRSWSQRLPPAVSTLELSFQQHE